MTTKRIEVGRVEDGKLLIHDGNRMRALYTGDGPSTPWREAWEAYKETCANEWAASKPGMGKAVYIKPGPESCFVPNTPVFLVREEEKCERYDYPCAELLSTSEHSCPVCHGTGTVVTHRLERPEPAPALDQMLADIGCEP